MANQMDMFAGGKKGKSRRPPEETGVEVMGPRARATFR